jgi:macrolide transport system ATP-binding/permease protein
MTSFFRRLSWLTRRRGEDEILEELQFHLDEEAEARQAEGMAQNEARWAAHRDLGNITLVKEETRAVWIWTFWEQLMQDLRYALRTMSNNRAFAALAVLSLALGIGANTAIYSFMDSILLRSLPVADPESLVLLNWHAQAFGGIGKTRVASVVTRMMGSINPDPKSGVISGVFPYLAFELLAKTDSVFSSVFSYHWAFDQLNVKVHGQADLAGLEFVSGNYFRGLGVPAAAGRLLLADDDRVGAPAVAVISYAYSRKRFGAPSQAVGNSVLVNSIPFTLVGVAAPEFFGVDPAVSPDVYLPLHANLLLEPPDPMVSVGQRYLDPHFYWVGVMARLRPGVSMGQAQATLGPMFHEWVLTTASNDQEKANLPALVTRKGGGGVDTLRRKYSKPLYVLLTLVGLILLIACSNMANLLLARATARRREIAVRLSIGAGRSRVIRQLLTESVLLASMGGAVGVLFAIWGIRVLTTLLSNGRENFTLHAELNGHVLAATMALSILTGILFGLVPAIQSTRVDVMPALKDTRAGGPETRMSGFFSHLTLGRALVVAQIAISLLMLVATGLFVGTLSNLQSIQLGFNRENMLLFGLNARQPGRSDSEISGFYRNLQEQFRSIPGVRAVGLSKGQPMDGGMMTLPFAVRGPMVPSATLGVGPAFFTALQLPILAGRDIEDRDLTGQPVAVVNELFAKAQFGKENPLGQHIKLGGSGLPETEMEIVGVCANARYGGLREKPQPIVYFVHNRVTFPPVGPVVFELRTAGDPLAYVKTVREIVHRADPAIPVSNIKTQTAQIDQLISQEITFARLCTAFAILALVITCVGLYGSVTYNVTRRTGEIGIRMALGAQRPTVLWMILREVFALAAAGLVIGIPAAFATSKLVASFLFEMKPNDPRALTFAVITLATAALLAGYVPARKASQIDPMVALRHE